LAALVVLALGCQPPAGRPAPDPGLEGTWLLCAGRTGEADVCGTIEVAAARQARPGEWYHPLRYHLSLGALAARFGDSDSVGTGVARATGRGGQWELQFPLDPQYLAAFDDGSIIASVQQRDGELAGRWARTCFVGCDGSGTVVLKRAVPSQGTH
jgi:hypothetical protein